jgi:hypothetical protein
MCRQRCSPRQTAFHWCHGSRVCLPNALIAEGTDWRFLNELKRG